MSRSKHKRKRISIFRYGLRSSVLVSLITSIFLFLLMLLFENSWEESAQISIISALFIALCTYVVSYFYGYRRIKFIVTLFKNISKKRFGDYGEISSIYNDEVDYLIRQGIKSSR